MKLWIAEKPELGRVIANALGVISKENGFITCKNNNIVTWCFGHIVEIQPPESFDARYNRWDESLKSIMPMRLYPLVYQPIEDKKNQVKLIGDLLKKADSVVHGGDIDDEGQLLIEEVLIYHNWRGKTERVLISDMSENAVKKAINNLKDNAEFKGQYLKGYARSAGDYIYGINMTRYLTISFQAKGGSGVISVGRVQTPTLSLIVNRYLANKSHSSSFFYDLKIGIKNQKGKVFYATLKPKDGDGFLLDEKSRIIEKSHLAQIKDKIVGSSIKVLDKSDVLKKTHPPLPYNIARLQQDMNNKYGYTADETLTITQSLREEHKCITYNRSDCSYLSEEQYLESNKLLPLLLNIDEYSQVKIENAIPKSKAFNDKNITAHTAIIPTFNIPKLNCLSDNEKNVYFAIINLYIAQFLPPKEVMNITGTFECANLTFTASYNNVISKGFENFLKPTECNEDEPQDDPLDLRYAKALYSVEPNSNILIESAEINQRKTTPPKLFTEATLISAMTRIADYVENPTIKALLKEKDKDSKDEYGSIGTSATRSAIIENLKKCGFISIQKRNIIPSEAAIKLIKGLPDLVKSPDLTAHWFSMQKDIEAGNLSVDGFVNALYSDINQLINSVDQMNFDEIANVEKITCPICDNSNFQIKPMVAECSCGFKIWRKIAGKDISASAIKNIAKDGKTKLIKGFKSKSGKSFNAYLQLDKSEKKLTFVFS